MLKNLLTRIGAFFKREDAFARAGVNRLEGLANAGYRRAEEAEKYAAHALQSTEDRLRADLVAEVAALKRTIAALKGQITKLSGKRGK